MITATLRNAVRKWDSSPLRGMRERLENKLLAQITCGTAQARGPEFLRDVNVMTACSEELLTRPIEYHVPYVEVDQETVLGDPNTLIRSQRSFRVF